MHILLQYNAVHIYTVGCSVIQ